MQVCGHHALHPTDQQQRSEHTASCTARHQRLAAREASEGVECGICLEAVMLKQPPGARKFGLMSCDHAFCLGCIKSWRATQDGSVDVETVRWDVDVMFWC